MALPVCRVLLLSVILTICDGRPQDSDGTVPCDTDQFANLDSCCKTPQLFPISLVKGCIDDMGKLAPGENETDFKSPDQEVAIKEFLSGAGGPMIAVECMFKNTSLLKTTGQIDEKKVEETFIKASESTWHDLIKYSLTQCTKKLSELNVTNVLETEFANVGPAFLMSCMRRLLILNCPESVKSKQDTSCVAKFDAVKKCGPFYISSGEEGGSGGWMRGVLRWLIGPQTWGQQSVKSESSKSFFLPNMFMPFSFMFPMG